MTIRGLALVVSILVFSVSTATGQGTQVPFSGLQHDSSLPVEVASDQLDLNQADGTATFSGNVVIGQGDMRITAAKVEVFYAPQSNNSSGQISKMIATGGVTVVNGDEAAEAEKAVYSVVNATITMTGNAMLTQGKNALSSEKMTINLDSGTATMDGRVRSILQSGTNE